MSTCNASFQAINLWSVVAAYTFFLCEVIENQKQKGSQNGELAYILDVEFLASGKNEDISHQTVE